MIVTQDFIYTQIWNWETLEFILEIISSNKNKIFIYDCQQEFETIDSSKTDMYVEIGKLATKNNIKILIVVGSLDFNYSTYPKEFIEVITVVNDPTYWLKVTVENLRLEQSCSNNFEYTHLFCSFVGRAHTHRCEFIDELYYTGANNIGKHTWNTINPYYKFEHWEQTVVTSSDDYYTASNNWKVNSIEYKNALLDIVLETTDTCTFYSEKTFKPILLKKPFIIFGAPNINTKLKNLGFELYSEIIDYRFDSIIDNKKRANILCNELIRISKQKETYLELYNKIKFKLEHNYKHALSLVHRNNFIPNQVYIKNYEEILKFNEYRYSKDFKLFKETFPFIKNNLI